MHFFYKKATPLLGNQWLVLLPGFATWKWTSFVSGQTIAALFPSTTARLNFVFCERTCINCLIGRGQTVTEARGSHPLGVFFFLFRREWPIFQNREEYALH